MCKERFCSGHLCKNQEGLLTTTSVNTEGPLKTEDEGIWDSFGLLCLLLLRARKDKNTLSFVDDRGEVCTLGMEG